jgi:hypothetical protein
MLDPPTSHAQKACRDFMGSADWSSVALSKKGL